MLTIIHSLLVDYGLRNINLACVMYVHMFACACLPSYKQGR